MKNTKDGTEAPVEHVPGVVERPNLALLGVRSTIGGVLMGLANLVPGISGGTMLLAAGIYTRFIESIAELTTLKFRAASIITLGLVVVSAALAIVLLAGPVKDLVVEQRWIMYSLFIGLTLGGVPLVWKMARPVNAKVWGGAAFGIAVMIAMLLLKREDAGADERNYVLLFVAGLAGASAMILPGVSGGYLLLLLGQYIPILSSIHRAKEAVSARQWGDAMAELHVFVPVGIGVVLGIVGISNLLKWLLLRFEKATLGVLLGLLIGAVFGLWPFQQSVAPEPGDIVKGQAVLIVEERPDDDGALRLVAVTEHDELTAEDWPVGFFSPGAGQILGSIVLIIVGFGVTRGVSMIGGERKGTKARRHAGTEGEPGATA